MALKAVVEFDSEANVCVVTVQGLPIIVQAHSEGEAIQMTQEAIALYFDDRAERLTARARGASAR